MNDQIITRLSQITEEEKEILAGRRSIDRSIYMDGSRDVISGEKLLERGKLIAVRPHTRFIAFPEHTHDYVEMVYMCQGETTHTVDGNRMVLHAGELLMLGQNARQAIEPAGERDLAVNFIVRPAFLGGILRFLGDEETPLRRFVLSCLRGDGEIDYLLFRAADYLPVQNLIENLIWTLIQDTPNKRGILQMTMGLLFAQLLSHTDLLAVADEEQQTTMRVLRYVEERYRDGSLTEIAAELNYEVSGLSRFIQRKTGQSYTELVQDKRLSQTAWMLRNTEERVEDIARAVGYENISYFHRIFQRRFGMTPKKYRDLGLTDF